MDKKVHRGNINSLEMHLYGCMHTCACMHGHMCTGCMDACAWDAWMHVHGMHGRVCVGCMDACAWHAWMHVQGVRTRGRDGIAVLPVAEAAIWVK